ncbi:MAG: UDP-3-O-(3-hydroxymyristoyl)glucosamine N-acyltransferase [Acidobacteria bacterium]|nr:UDP-3-O-(3-hydroxymyristoyl)glucosamine N-acyltransferase [Acidobacteriota bacterium]
MAKTAGELAAYLEGELMGDPSVTIRGVASPARAEAGDLVYVESEKWLPEAVASAASVVLVGTDVFVRGKTFIRVAQPKRAFARAVAWLLPEPPLVTGRHPTAVVHPSARLADDVALGPYVVVEEHAQVGRRCQLGAGCTLGAGVELGDDTVLFPRVTVYRNVRIGQRVRIHSGAVIGSDGFGYVPTEAGWEKFPQRGTVVIEDDVEIGANVTIDRGALEETRIGRGTKLDNLVHVGHNVRLGEHGIVEAQTGISGSVTVGDRVILGGQVGIADHVRIEDGAILAGQAGVPSNKIIRRGQVVWGTPARPLAEFKKTYPYLARLPELAQRLAALERKLSGK